MHQELALGIQDYREIREGGYYYVDKTEMITEFLKRKAKVTLVTRPRRFGKTLNMSMLAEFLDITKDSKEIFKDTAVMSSAYAEEINQHPVIFLSFKDAKGPAHLMAKSLKAILLSAYQKYSYAFRNMDLIDSNTYRSIMNDLLERQNCLDGVDHALLFLTKMVAAYYDKQVILLIDEYDVPFLEASVNGYYDEVHAFLSAMLATSLKGNEYLKLSMLTGIQRVARENIFSGLNNLLVCTVKDPEFSHCFGFTEAETKELLDYYHLELNSEVKRMYNGYRFSEVQIYNPWSIINYAQRKKLAPYWVNTSENKMIRSAMDKCSSDFFDSYEEIIEKNEVCVSMRAETSFYESPSIPSLWGLLLNAGMITIEQEMPMDYYRVRIPNLEVRSAFAGLTEHYLHLREGTLAQLFGALLNQNKKEFLNCYRKILLQLPSYYDLKDENSYHMMMLGMCAYLWRDYEISSNREQGEGRSDILLQARDQRHPHMIFEFKFTKDEGLNLLDLAEDAVNQISARNYDAGLSGTILYIGLAHCKKQVQAVWKSNEKGG